MEITVHNMLECLTQWTHDLYNMDTDIVPKRFKNKLKKEVIFMTYTLHEETKIEYAIYIFSRFYQGQCNTTRGEDVQHLSLKHYTCS